MTAARSRGIEMLLRVVGLLGMGWLGCYIRITALVQSSQSHGRTVSARAARRGAGQRTDDRAHAGQVEVPELLARVCVYGVVGLWPPTRPERVCAGALSVRWVCGACAL